MRGIKGSICVFKVFCFVLQILKIDGFLFLKAPRASLKEDSYKITLTIAAVDRACLIILL